MIKLKTKLLKNTLGKFAPGVCTVVLLGGYSLAGLAASAAVPNMSGFWASSYEGQPSAGAQELIDKLPADAVFIDDAGLGELGEGDFGGLVISERALKEISEYDFNSELAPETSCTAPSVTFYMQAPFPFEIHQGRDIVAFKIEYFDAYRLVFMDGREHPPADAPHSKSGHSVGHWEGDELVVDTTHISPATFMNNGFMHSENIHMLERFKLSEDGKTLWSTEVLEDPEVFSGLAARFVTWQFVPEEYVYPYECNPGFWEE